MRTVASLLQSIKDELVRVSLFSDDDVHENICKRVTISIFQIFTSVQHKIALKKGHFYRKKRNST